MEKTDSHVILPCDCKCCMVVVERTAYDDGDVIYDVSIQDSRYDHNYNTIWGRIKRAASALFGKPVYFNDACIDDPERFRAWVNELEALVVQPKKED